MEEKKKKTIFILIITIALVILIGVGSTFAYFSASIGSNEDAVSMGAAEFQIEFSDDTSLIKTTVIPSIEAYVDIAAKRVDENGNFLKPTKDETTGEEIKDGTVCIDDNLNEICSVYTFTIKNPMTEFELPLYITLNPSVNSFENLYFKVLDSELNEVISATKLVDDRYQMDDKGNYLKDEEGKLIPKENFDTLTISPVVLTNINKTLGKATDENTPAEVTYSIVIWIMETGENQTDEDSGKVFAGSLQVTASGANGKGITGTFSAAGVE